MDSLSLLTFLLLGAAVAGVVVAVLWTRFGGTVWIPCPGRSWWRGPYRMVPAESMSFREALKFNLLRAFLRLYPGHVAGLVIGTVVWRIIRGLPRYQLELVVTVLGFSLTLALSVLVALDITRPERPACPEDLPAPP